MTILFFSASLGRSAVVVFDRVTSLKTPVYLKVLTKGRFFVQGGKLVDIYLDGKPLKKILTGGDGYGYLKYTPQRLGLRRMEARSDGEGDTGLLLVAAKTDKVILIEIEGALKESLFSEKTGSACRKAIETLGKKYRIIYLYGYLGKSLVKKWLDKEGFPESAILPWQGPEMLSALKEKGVNLYAMVGSAETVAEAGKQIEKRYTFEETRDGRTVKDWDEILNLLLKGKNKSRPEVQ
jgi:predicted Fe-Mo cluster-binding NifX family protein